MLNSYTFVVLPGKPLRCLVLEANCIVPLRVLDNRVWLNSRFRRVVDSIVVDSTVAFRGRLEARRSCRLLTLHPSKFHDFTETYEGTSWKVLKKVNMRMVAMGLDTISTRYLAYLYNHDGLYLVKPRMIYYKLKQSALQLDKQLSLYNIHEVLDDLKRDTGKTLLGAYYISRKKIINLAGYRGFENANYMVLMRNYVVLLA